MKLVCMYESLKTNVKTSTRYKKSCRRFRRVRLTLFPIRKRNDSSDSWLSNGFLQRALRIKTILLLFSFFFWFLFNHAIQGKSITSRLVNSTLNCTRFVWYRFSCAIWRGIPSSGNEFSYNSRGKTLLKYQSKSSFMITTLILMITLFYKVLIF